MHALVLVAPTEAVRLGELVNLLRSSRAVGVRKGLGNLTTLLALNPVKDRGEDLEGGPYKREKKMALVRIAVGGFFF